RFVRRASPDSQEASQEPCGREVRIQHERLVEKIDPRGEIAAEVSERMTAARERDGVVLAQVDCQAREARALGGFPSVVRRPAVDPAPKQAPRSHSVGGRVIGVELDGLVKGRERPIDVVARRNVEARHSAQEIVVGVEVLRRLSLRALDLRALELLDDRADDALGDPILQLEHVAESALITLGPKMPARLRVDELARDADAVGSFADAAFEQIAHAELATDLLHVAWPAPIAEARIAGDDE